MYAISVMYDYLRENVSIKQWDEASWKKCKTILENVAELDVLLEQPDCVDLAKEKYVEEVEKELKEKKDKEK